MNFHHHFRVSLDYVFYSLDDSLYAFALSAKRSGQVEAYSYHNEHISLALPQVAHTEVCETEGKR
jgi:hypothetical protein